MTEIRNVTIRADPGAFNQIKVLDYIPNYDISSRDKNIRLRDHYSCLFKIDISNIMIHRERNYE